MTPATSPTRRTLMLEPSTFTDLHTAMTSLRLAS
jgi:hypothetical protein